jgi:ABC-type uncharacterized transport system permease subunit
LLTIPAPPVQERERQLILDAMHGSLLLNLSALGSLVPVSVLSLRRAGTRDGLFWMLLAVAIAGPAVAAIDQMAQGWLSGLSATLWLSIVASMAMFLAVSAVTRDGWRLAPLLLPYLFLLGIGAAAAEYAAHPAGSLLLGSWTEVHILVSVATYGLLTLAAIAGLAVFLQERALKRRRPSGLTALLPSVADAETLQIQLLGASGVVLGLGLLTGAATQYVENGDFLEFNHKTIFALSAFVVIALLLAVHHRTGVRGRQAARFVLLAYLLVTLAYPGVKFVRDVILG